MTRDGKTYFYLADALGSVVAVTDEAGAKANTYSYSPRGVTRSTSSEKTTQPYQFAGGYQDPTGLYHYAARYYDPNIGRFTQRDPSGQEENPYLYAEGDPVNRIDPGGLGSIGISGEVCAFGGCIGGGVAINDDGFVHPSVSAGVGSPGASGGIDASSSDATSGPSANIECSAGPYKASVSNEGDTTAGISTEYSSPGCSARAQYTF